MKEKAKSLKYTLIIIVMFIVGIVVGVTLSSIKGTKKEHEAPTKKDSITVESAKNIALENAKKDFKKEATLDTEIYVEVDNEDGIEVYEVNFYLEGVRYEYKIATSDGKIIDKDIELMTNNNSISDNPIFDTDKKDIEKAKKVILKEASLKESDVTFEKQEKEVENGKNIFEFEFSTRDKKYEYEVNATTLEIIQKEMELKNKNVTGTKNINEDEPKRIAFNASGVKEKEVTIIKKVELETEKNRKVYEVEFVKGNIEYECEIDVSSGTVLKLSWKLS